MLVLRLVRRVDGVALRPISRPIEATGLTIGRAAECDVVLDDPLRLVSRRHAWIAPHSAHEAVLQCVSTSAALRVNGETLPPGAECLIVDGDRIAIGAFELAIEAPLPAETTLTQLARPVAPDLSPPPPAAPPSPSAPPSTPFRASRLDQWFDLDTVADPLGPGSPLAPLETAAAPPMARPLREPDRQPEPQPVLGPRPPAAPPTPPSPPAAPVAPATAPISSPPLSAEPQTESDGLALREAFLRGAGLHDSVPLGPDPAWAAHAGALLRTLTDETFELLRTRAVTKQSIRAEGTRIVARENNPLKFAPDASACLRLLLQQRARPGFLDPIDALHDAHEDLQLHQIAMVAGMRAAVAELILRLGPASAEEAAGPPQGLARWLPWWREVVLWRRHRETHAALVAGLDDAFDAAFGREFLLAYEAQTRRVRNRPDAGDSPQPPT